MRSIHPALDLSRNLEDTLVEHFFTFASGGLKALNIDRHRVFPRLIAGDLSKSP
jgi:hypothetical protein